MLCPCFNPRSQELQQPWLRQQPPSPEPTAGGAGVCCWLRAWADACWLPRSHAANSTGNRFIVTRSRSWCLRQAKPYRGNGRGGERHGTTRGGKKPPVIKVKRREIFSVDLLQEDRTSPKLTKIQTFGSSTCSLYPFGLTALQHWLARKPWSQLQRRR